ncbi:MAG: hypothetical protein ACLQOQ_10735 [Beijerinckiaceae bacterium]
MNHTRSEGSHATVTELETAIANWITHRNQNPKPFNWTPCAKSNLAKQRRAKIAFAKAKLERE